VVAPGIGVFELGKLDLEFGLGGLCAGGEYVENQFAAVDDFGGDYFLKLPDLTREQVVVEYDDIGAEPFDPFGELFDLAFADIKCGMDFMDFLLKPVNDNGARAFRQGGKLFEVIVVFLALQYCPD
jgi:hypothetical protein